MAKINHFMNIFLVAALLKRARVTRIRDVIAAARAIKVGSPPGEDPDQQEPQKQN